MNPTTPKEPRNLGDRASVVRRVQRIWEPHVAPLNQLVERIREARGGGDVVPWFDPDGGGVEARILFLAEAPSRQAASSHGGSGFISPDNDDWTAEHTFEFRDEAGVPRSCLVHWNIVPWYVGTTDKIRAVTDDDLDTARPWLTELLGLLPQLRVVMLVGKKAQRGWKRAGLGDPRYGRTVDCRHPSRTNVNTRPDTRELVVDAYREAFRLADDVDS